MRSAGLPRMVTVCFVVAGGPLAAGVDTQIFSDGLERGATCAWSATVSPSLPGGCLIDQVYWCADDLNPSNDCEACVPAESTGAWTALANGSPCDDGFFCTTGDLCTAGFCFGDGTCDDGIDCTMDECDEQQQLCSFLPVDQACDDSNTCTDDFCDDDLGCIHEPICGSGARARVRRGTAATGA